MAAKSKSLLIIGHVWPQPHVSAAGWRMMQLIRSFIDAGYSVHFASAAEIPAAFNTFRKLNVKTLHLPLNDKRSSTRIRDLQPDVVLFDRFMTEEQFGWRVQKEAPRALRILNTEDLHSIRHARQQALEQGTKYTPDFWLQKELTLRELASILRADLSLIISGKEYECLAETGIIAEAKIVYLPFMLDNINDYKIDSYTLFNQRSDFMFIGFGKHNPNADAVRFLITAVWPNIHKKIPGASLAVYGRDYPADIHAMHNPLQGIHIKGWRETLDPVIARTRVNLAPLRFGAGLKGKIVHALQQGTPSVMTSIAAEGLFDGPGFEQLIADDPGDFSEKAVLLHENESVWKQAVVNTRDHLAQELDRGRHHMILHARVDTLRERLASHRAADVIGRMLNHQSLQSTRYMAKWIEAKNVS